MTESVKDSVSINAAALLIHYSFDLNGYTADELVAAWAGIYQPLWIRSAVIEALYQGRYKGISVEQILALWLRRGQPLYHFNHEFERIVCSRFPQVLAPKPATAEEIAALPAPKFPPQSHWRYLLPAATQTDNLPAAFVNAAATELPSLAVSSLPPQSKDLNFMSIDEEPQPDESWGTQLDNASESTIAALALNSSSTTIAEVAAESVLTTLEPSSHQPEVVIESSAPSDPTLPLISSSSPTEMALESDIAADVSLESVLEEADRLLSDLAVTDSEASGLEMTQAGQAKPEPIHQFVPPPESSEFYTKLKAVAQPQENSLALSEPLSSSETKSQRA